MAAAATDLLRSLLLLALLSSLLIRPSESTALHRRSDEQNSAVFAGECLNGHNSLRAGLGIPPLQWSTSLAEFAESWLKVLKGSCDLIHSAGDLGENLFWGSGSGWTASQAVGAWAAERWSYNYGSNTCAANQDCTHYSQMVWRSTTAVGCAMIKCSTGDTLVACEYSPPGNFIGQRPY